MANNYPVAEVLANMEEQIAKGAECYIKYDCELCGLRQMSEEPNTWHPAGYICCECGHLTKPEEINFMVVISLKGDGS